jgi:hypothetical protein
MSAVVDLDKQNPDLLLEAMTVVAQSAGVMDDRGSVVREFADAAAYEAFKAEDWGRQPLT